MATATIGITCANTVGSTNFKVKFRLMGDSIWSTYLIPPPSTSGTTATETGLLYNRIYEFQVQNLNGADNALSLITQDIGFTDPIVTLSPTNISIGYSFANLSVDIDSYTVQITTATNPGTILATHVLPAGVFPNTITDQFTGLLATTAYRLIISPVANQFTQLFVHTFTTDTLAMCADVSNITVVLS